MPERVIKIILPKDQAKTALALLDNYPDLTFWQEELSTKTFVVSILINSVQSEQIMDLLEKKFSKIKGFKLILFPVEASIPRPKEEKRKTTPIGEKKEIILKLRISREELYSDIVDSAKRKWW